MEVIRLVYMLTVKNSIICTQTRTGQEIVWEKEMHTRGEKKGLFPLKYH